MVVVLVSAAAFVGAFMTLAFGLNSIAQALLCIIMLIQLGICWYTFMLQSVVSTMYTEAGREAGRRARTNPTAQPDLVGPDGV